MKQKGMILIIVLILINLMTLALLDLAHQVDWQQKILRISPGK